MSILIDEKLREKCYNFAEKIILTNNQYNRVPATIKKRIQRTYAGKLAEYVFLMYIRENFNQNYDEGGMFEIYDGQTNVDSFDFITITGQKVDIKAAFLPNHFNITIPLEQLNNIPKSYYIGIKLNGEFEEINGDKQLVDIHSITKGEIIGMIDYNSVLSLNTEYRFGPPCKMVKLNSLKKINLEF